MLDFFDDESLGIGNILGRDTLESHKRKANGEEGLHGLRLGNAIQSHGAQESTKALGPQRERE